MEVCKLCGAGTGLKKCNRCKSAWYCSVDHQKQDWPAHKLQCKPQNQEPQTAEVYRQYDLYIAANPETFQMYPEEIVQLNTRKPTVQETDILGLQIFHNFLTDQEHDELAAMALQDKEHAGRDDTQGKYSHLMSTCPFIPSVGLYYYLNRICGRLIKMKAIPHMPAQLTINYYEPNEGLEPHTDNVDIIKEWIVGISLMSSCVIDFTSNSESILVKRYPLFPGSIMIQSGTVRYQWKHGISPDPVHNVGDFTLKREFRVSIQLSDFSPSYFHSKEALSLKVKDVQK